MLTDACFKEGLSAALKPETSLDNDNNNTMTIIIIIIIIIIMITIIIIIIIIITIMIIIMTTISDKSEDLRKKQLYQKRSTGSC